MPASASCNINTPPASYGMPGDVTNRIPIDSAYPGGKSMGMPAASRYRQAAPAASMPLLPTRTNYLPLLVLAGLVLLVWWGFK